MIKLSPSDFAYLYQDCKYCYYKKIKEGITLPSMPMPGVFAAINTRIQGTLVNKNLKDLSADLPDGIIESQEGWVESGIVPSTDVYIKGKYDLLVRQSNDTYILVDLKISRPNDDHVDKYKSQLGSYHFALQNPAQGKPINVTRMGLLIFYPDIVTFKEGKANLEFPPKWMEVPVDEKGFLTFAKEVDELLAGSLPKETKDCKWCLYRHANGSGAANEDSREEIPF